MISVGIHEGQGFVERTSDMDDRVQSQSLNPQQHRVEKSR